MQATNRTRKIFTALSVVIVAGALIGAVAWHPARQIPVAVQTVTSAVPVTMVGVPTGEFQNGAAVYRLPTIAVTVSRSEALAAMAREDSLAIR